MSEVTKITYAEYLQVMGMLAIAHKHMTIVNDCQKYIEDIIEPHISDGFGHVGDAIFQPYTVDELLNRAEIKVEKRPKK